MADKTANIAQALVDVDTHLKVTLESIGVQKAAMKVVHGLNWKKAWNDGRASIMKRYYNLLEKKHVLTLLRDNPGRIFYGQTEIIGVVNSDGKMIKRFKGWKHFRIADWSEWAGTKAQRIAQLGDIKTTSAIISDIKKYITGGVKGSFRPGSTIKKQINKERYALRRAKALKGFLMLQVQDVLTGEYHLEIIDPKKLKPSIIVPYGHVHESTLPRPKLKSTNLPTDPNAPTTARGKQKKKVSPWKVYAGGTSDNANDPKGDAARGKGKVKPPLELTTYTPDRGTRFNKPTAKERGTDTSNKPGNRVDNIIHATSHSNTFKLKLSAKYPKTIAALKFGGSLIFNMLLASVVARFREGLSRKAAGMKLKEVFEKHSTQSAIEKKLTELAYLTNKDDKPYYVQVQLFETWLGAFRSNGTSIDGFQSPMEFRFNGVAGPTGNDTVSCEVTSINQVSGASEGVKYKHQVCGYPLLINPPFQLRVERDNRIQRWESCITSELGLKSAGPHTPEELEAAERICTKKGGRPIEKGPNRWTN